MMTMRTEFASAHSTGVVWPNKMIREPGSHRSDIDQAEIRKQHGNKYKEKICKQNIKSKDENAININNYR